MKATIFIWPEQRGQISGSNSYTRLMSMAQIWLARLRAGADSVAAPGRGSRRCCRSGSGLLAPQAAGLVRVPAVITNQVRVALRWNMPSELGQEVQRVEDQFIRHWSVVICQSTLQGTRDYGPRTNLVAVPGYPVLRVGGRGRSPPAGRRTSERPSPSARRPGARSRTWRQTARHRLLEWLEMLLQQPPQVGGLRIAGAVQGQGFDTRGDHDRKGTGSAGSMAELLAWPGFQPRLGINSPATVGGNLTSARQCRPVADAGPQ